MQLPPHFQPQMVGTPSATPEELVSVERVWEEVGGRGRHRQRLEKQVTSSPPQKKAGLSLAFKRRTYGLYF
jgi:hypothetical protein